MLLDDFDIELVERKKYLEEYISASLVRELLQKDVELIKPYVPIESYERIKNDFKR